MNNENFKFWQKQWFMWVLLILCPILGIIVLWGCNKKFNITTKIILTIVFVFWLFILCIVKNDSITTDNNQKLVKNETKTQKETSPKWLIAEHDYGENYPYTEYYLTIYTYNNGVWLEDVEGNKYALNGIAINLLKNHKKYKGTTDAILKKGMADLYLPAEALKYAIKLTNGEFKAIMQ